MDFYEILRRWWKNENFEPLVRNKSNWIFRSMASDAKRQKQQQE